MTELVTTWVLWIIVSTVNPNLNYFSVMGELTEPKYTKEHCLIIAEESAPVIYKNLAEYKLEFESVSVHCIPVVTRIPENANEPLLQPLPRKNNQRTTPG